MNCNMNVYMGEEPYVYLINSHRDDGVVFPMIERLAKKGLRIWHDVDMRSIQSEWKSTTSKKLNGSSAVLVVMSQNFVQTHICRRQLTDAIESKKKVFVVRLDKPILTLGMKLQAEVSTLLDCEFPPTDYLVDSLLEKDGLKFCMGAPNLNIEVQAYRRETEYSSAGPSPLKKCWLSDQTIFELEKDASSNIISSVYDEKPNQRLQNDVFAPRQEEEDKTVDYSLQNEPICAMDASYDQTVVSSSFASQQETEIDTDSLDATIIPKRVILPVIVSMSTGIAQKGLNGETVVGRNAKLQTGALADIRFTERCKLFSRRHFKLIYIDNTCTLICLHENGLTFNGLMELSPNEPLQAEGTFVVEVPRKSVIEQFLNKEDASARFVIAYEIEAKRLWDASFVAILESVETGEIRAFWNFPIMIGRKYSWSSGAMSTKTISSEHAIITLEDGSFFIEDRSKNGTIINNDVFCHHEKHLIESGTILRIDGKREENLRDENFIFRFVKVERVNEV